MSVAMRVVVVGGLVGLTALMGCGDSSGGGGDVADAGDTLQSDVEVPGPGECELNWVDGFSPVQASRPPMVWSELDPGEVGTVAQTAKFVGGPGVQGDVAIQTCQLVDGALHFSASSAFDQVNFSLEIVLAEYPGPGTWMLGVDDGLEVRFDFSDVAGPAAFVTRSSSDTMCELCIDATGRQGAFRCDDLVEEAQGLRGGISYAGFICPDQEPGFAL